MELEITFQINILSKYGFIKILPDHLCATAKLGGTLHYIVVDIKTRLRSHYMAYFVEVTCGTFRKYRGM